MSQPQLAVFDLDFTLWDCDGTWCDCLSPPFCRDNGRVTDGHGRVIRLYDDVLTILDQCDASGIRMALASRTEQPAWAVELVDLLVITDRFAFSEIYPTSKLRHFAALREESGINYADMLFFDDEMRNISEVSKLGVTCIHVSSGMTLPVFQSGLATHSRQQ